MEVVAVVAASRAVSAAGDCVAASLAEGPCARGARVDVDATGAGVATTGAGVTTGAALAAFGVGGTPPRGADAIGALVACEEELFGLYVLKNSIHAGSREEGFAK